jgi:hypothetical protein
MTDSFDVIGWLNGCNCPDKRLKSLPDTPSSKNSVSVCASFTFQGNIAREAAIVDSRLLPIEAISSLL